MSTAAKTRHNGESVLYVDIPVIPLGQRLSLHGWSKEQVSEAILPNVPTNAACWYCSHRFDWAPVRLPIKRDDRPSIAGNIRDLFYSDGQFCTFSCAKAHVLFSTQGPQNKSCSMYLALLANKARHLEEGETSNANNAIMIKAVPSKYKLIHFGGNMTIEEFRQGCMRLDGSICGDGPRMFDFRKPRSRREEIEPPCFIDKSIVTIVRCIPDGTSFRNFTDNGISLFNTSRGTTNKQAASAPIMSADGGSNQTIREKMAISRKRREQGPAAQKSGANTLECSMGVIVKKNKKK